MLTKPIRFGEKELADLEGEIRSVVPREKILMPDDVRRGEPTLPDALRKYGWPMLDAIRGKILFGLDNEGAVRDLYLKNHPALEGKVLFVSVPDTNAAAAWMKVNDPVGDFERIRESVRKGFLVRTRADSDKAFASGAQFISTDYREPNLKFSSYSVAFEGGQVARANPVSGTNLPPTLDLENPLKR